MDRTLGTIEYAIAGGGQRIRAVRYQNNEGVTLFYESTTGDEFIADISREQSIAFANAIIYMAGDA